MNKNSSLRRFLNNIYGFSFFNALLLLAPVYTIFMQDCGMTEMELSISFIVWSVAVFTLQIPAAWLSEKIGQKNIIIIGQIFKAAAFTLWILWPSFWGFCLGQFLWGVQGAIYNVAFEGMMYDELRARKHHKFYAKVLGRRKNISAIGSALSASGSLLLFFGYEWITALSVLALGISTIFVARIRIQHKPRVTKSKKNNSQNFLKVFGTGAKIIRGTPCIFYMLLLTVLVGNFSYFNDYLSVIGVEVGLRKEFIGIVPFFIQGCQMIGNFFAHRFTHVRDRTLFTAVSVGGVIFVLFSIFYSVPALLLLGLAYVLFSIIKVLMYSRFQDFVPSTYRSVMLSIYSIADQIMYMSALLVIGLGGSMGSWRYSSLFLGMICVAIGIWAILFVKDRCAVGQNPNIRVVKTRQSTSSVSPSQF